MARENFNELLAFVAVAREGSFTRAAKQLGVSQSALSHTIRALETRFDLRLLTRTTRSVSPTQAGERLLATLAPRFDEIEAELLALTALRDRPAGLLRIGAPQHAAETILLPALARLLPQYPALRIELHGSDTPADPGENGEPRLDAAVRLGEHLARGMTATRIGPDLRMAVVAAPGYFTAHPAPATPAQLTSHDCITLHRADWAFARDGVPMNVHVAGQMAVNSLAQLRTAALAGLGVAWILEDVVAGEIAGGRLVRVLDAWCAPFAGYHLHYPSRGGQGPALALVLAALQA